MYYHTPDVKNYTKFIRRFRAFILTFFVFIALFIVLFFKPTFISSDTQFWLQESQELERTHAQSYETSNVSVLSVQVPIFNEESKQKLQKIQKELSHHASISKVDSLFSSYYIYNDTNGDDSSMVATINLKELSVLKVKELITQVYEPYRHFVDPNFKTFQFFIYADASISMKSFNIPYEYTYTDVQQKSSLSHYLGYILLIILLIIILFRLIFNNYISSIAALSVITLTLIGTFAIIYLITGISDIHIAISLIVISITMVEYLHFYYRWHVAQYKIDSKRAIENTINRNFIPAFWTSFLTFLGLGGLLFIDSEIIKLLSLSVITPSVLAYFLNVTFLPALLSYFKVEHPKVHFATFCLIFAKNEIHYNRKYLHIFLATTTILMSIGAYQFFFQPERIFYQEVDKGVITLKVPYDELDVALIEKLQKFEKDIKRDNEDITNVSSIASVLELLNLAEDNSTHFDDQSLMQAIFFLELYDLEPKLITDNSLSITINFKQSNQTKIILWLRAYKNLDLYFTDTNTILSSAKLSNAVLLGGSLTTALIVIGLIMGWVFRSNRMILVGFIVNAIPIIWFGMLANALYIPLSLELLIAMTISVGLASDSTVHFAFKYFRSRRFGRTKKHSLEKMFFYAGIPIIVGSIILAFVFSMMMFTKIHTLQLIGGYGAALIMTSLLVDLFVLPVLLLAVDKFEKPNKQVKSLKI